jgi:hypothetical protein
VYDYMCVIRISLCVRVRMCFVEVCWRCMADHGSDSLDYCYTNLNGSWRETIDVSPAPWEDRAPAMASLPGFHLHRTLGLDLLHIWHIGCGRDLAGSALKVLIGRSERESFFEGRTISLRLKTAYRSCKKFAKDNRMKLQLSQFSKSNLQWGNQYPMVRCKGADTMVIVKWLASLNLSEMECRLATCLWTANCLLEILMNGGIFLKPDEASTANWCGEIYLKMYLSLARSALDEGKWLFKIRPKFHLLTHIVFDLKDRPSRRNCHNDSTFMDEDFVRKIMMVSKKTSVVTTTMRTIQRYLLKLPSKLTP